MHEVYNKCINREVYLQMKIKKNCTNIIKFLMTLMIVLSLSYIFWITWYGYYRNMVVRPFYQKGALLFTVVYIIIYMLFSRIYGGHKIGYFKVTEIIYSQSLSIVFTNIITYMQLSLIAKDLVNPLMLIIMTLVDILAVIIWSFISNKLYFSINPPIKMLMIYRNESVSSLLLKMNGHKESYQICSAISIEEGLKVILKEIDKYEGIVLCDISSDMRNDIVKYCFKKSVRIYMTPKISDIIIQSSEKLHIFDTPLLLCKNQGLTYEQRVLKRAIDIVVSSVAIILLLPSMFVVAVLIKIYDGGPIIFKQKRLTINNQVFEIYKFRSMVVNAEKNGEARLACKNDDRITPIGKIIRKIRFDELPQLFNILKGDMSIVGPRPERPEIAEKYIEIMPEFEFRTKVKAGLTGYAQIMGKYNTIPYDKLKLDLIYIGNYTIYMDIKLMIMTVKILFMPASTEGVNDGELLPELIAFGKENSNS